MRPTSAFLVLLSVVALWLPSTLGWGSSQDKVLLEKVTAITLEEGKMTNSRRVSPVQQLECAGGSAGCYGYRPKVVQCVNTGFDGYNVQWECKAEMDSKYRFGHLDVSCEGYDYPDDPYVLRGSCGLRYQLDFTEEGYQTRDYGRGNPGYDSTYHHGSKSSGFGIGTLIQLCIIGVIIYCVLGSCFGSRQRAASGYSHSSGGYGSSGYHPTAGSSGPGFWTGAATGGALGYLLGGNRRGYYGGGGYGRTGWFGGGYGGGGYTSGYSSHHGSRGSSSRTTSGFGSTSRR